MRPAAGGKLEWLDLRLLESADTEMSGAEERARPLESGPADGEPDIVHEICGDYRSMAAILAVELSLMGLTAAALELGRGRAVNFVGFGGEVLRALIAGLVE